MRLPRQRAVVLFRIDVDAVVESRRVAQGPVHYCFLCTMPLSHKKKLLKPVHDQ